MIRPLAALALLAAAVLAPQPGAAQIFQQTGTEGVPLTVEADDGIEWVRESRTYVARGNAKAVRGDVVLTADRLSALYRDKDDGGTEIFRIEANGNVVITSPRERATAQRAIYDLDQAVVVLLGDNLAFQTGEDRITARDSLEYWEVKQLAVARGDAVALRGDQRISADTLTAYFRQDADSQAEIDRVDALGGVTIATPEVVARGREGVYNVTEGTATLTGDVKITRGDNQLNGDRAVVDMNTGVSRLLPGARTGDGRVKVLITPSQDSQ